LGSWLNNDNISFLVISTTVALLKLIYGARRSSADMEQCYDPGWLHNDDDDDDDATTISNFQSWQRSKM